MEIPDKRAEECMKNAEKQIAELARDLRYAAINLREEMQDLVCRLDRDGALNADIGEQSSSLGQRVGYLRATLRACRSNHRMLKFLFEKGTE